MDTATFTINQGELADVPLSLIDPDPDQPRKDFDEDYINNELAPSIKVSGVIQPVIVRSNPAQPGRFLLVDGENRFRASKVAKKKSIPAILREEEGLNLLMTQLKTLQRRGLNPLEWAQSFITMHKVHGLKYTEIEKTLKENGVGQYGRSYISNIVRLLELPEWAQSLIRNNAITAAHGKYLIPAMASEKVINNLREKFEEENWNPTTAELQRDIYWDFSRNHKDLTGYKTAFDYRVKCVGTGCQKLRKISIEGGQESTFCLDEQCHAILQAEAKREENDRDEHEANEGSGGGESAPREITFDDEGRADVHQLQLQYHKDYIYLSDADFDTRGCEECKHRRVALEDSDAEDSHEEQSCFLLSCFQAKDDEAARAERLALQYITDRVSSVVSDNITISLGVLAWVACNCPRELMDGDEYVSVDGAPFWEDDEEVNQLLIKHRLTDLKSFIYIEPNSTAELTELVVSKLYKNHITALFKILGLKADDYRIDAHYLAEHTAEELALMLNAMQWAPATFAELANAEKQCTVDQFARNHAEAIGVPAAIRFAFASLLKEEQEDE